MALFSFLKSNALTISIVANAILIVVILAGRQKETPQSEPRSHLKSPTFFAEYFKVDNRILFVGNSLISKCNWAELLQNNNIINKGIGGITTYEIFMRYNKLIEGKPNKVFFLMGINDLEQRAPKDYIMENYHRILYQLKATSPLTKIYFISLFPVNPELRPVDSPIISTNEIVNDFNLTIRNFTDTFGINYIDVNSILKNNSGKIDSTFSTDGIHIKQLGYEKIKAIIKEKVEE